MAAYVCPMHPHILQDKPGRCPECGMALVQSSNGKAEHKEHDKHEGHSLAMFIGKFWVSLALTLPIVMYSELPLRVFGRGLPEFVGLKWIVLLLGSVIFFYGGWVFLIGAVREIRGRAPGMMTLIGIAILAAYSFSVFETFRGGHTLFWELATLITIMLLGHFIEMRAVQGVQGALKELAKLLPDKAEVMRNSNIVTILLSELNTGDLVLVRPGGKIPADGVIAEGGSDIDESLVTGESRPVARSTGDKVIAGAINGDGSLKIRVTEIGEKTFLAGVMRLVAEAQASRSKLQILSDRAAFYLTVIALSAGGITFVSWLLAGSGIVTAVERLVAVLVVACPHALGLAVPLVASISTTMAARKGFLVKQRLALEAARSIDLILFDKTGTLTKGEFGIGSIIPEDDATKETVLQLAASVNANSEHPIAKAINREAKKQDLPLLVSKNFQRIPGRGATAEVDGVPVIVGSERILPPGASPLAGQPGHTIIYVVRNKILVGTITLLDEIRAESREALTILRKAGIKTAMITGDSEDVAEWVAGELGIDEFFAEVLPEQKSNKVKILQDRGLKVAMVGDGVNDAPALSQADLGIAIGSGTNVAIESAGIILIKNDPRDIPKIIKLSKLTYNKMIQNLFWATGYNVIALPLAAGALAFQGIILQPALAALFMSLSTVIVAVNALLLRRADLS